MSIGTLPLSRFTVLDLTHARAGPTAVRQLADWGANVIKIGDRETRDIADIFNLNPTELRRRRWHDPANAPDYDAMSDDELVIHARNREALCLYAWHPCLYNPQLKQWLGRIHVPTLLLWGASDRVVTPEYGRAYSALIPGSRFAPIDEAGHHPEIEQPEHFVEQVVAFIRE